MKKIVLFSLAATIFASTVFAQTASNVGIGTNTPLTKLDVNGAYSARFSSATAAATITIPNNVSLFRILAHTGVDANVISATTPADGQFLVIINEDDNPATFGSFTIAANNGVGSYIYIGGTVNAWRLQSDNNTGSNAFNAGNGLSWSGTTLNSVWTKTGSDISNNNTGGNVGIGTPTPSGTLDVEGGTATGTSNGSNININAQSGGTGGVTNGGNVSITSGTGANGGAAGSVNLNTLPSTPGAVNVATGTADQSVNIANGAANKTVNVGSTTGTSTTNINAGTGGLNVSTLTGGGLVKSAAGTGRVTNANQADVTAAANGAFILNQATQQPTSNFNISNNGVIGGTLTLSPMTQGSVYFAGSGGVISQDNANLFWDATNHRLGIGTPTPGVVLDVAGGVRTNNGFIANNGGTGTPSIRFTNDANSGIYLPAASNIGFVVANKEIGRFNSTSLALGNTAGATNGSLVFNNSTNANTVTISSGVTTASYPLTLPTGQGGSNTVLTNNGSGALSWASVSTLGGVTSVTAGAPLSSSGGTTPNITLSGVVPVANGGTNLSSLGSANQVLGVNTAGTGLEYKTIQAGTNVTLTPTANNIKIDVAGSGLTGSGTTNYLPKWTSSNTLSSTSMVYDNGTNVGIGTNNPLNKLQVEGNLHMDGYPIYLRSGATDQYDLIRWNSSVDRIEMGGYNGVILGYTSPATNVVSPTLTVASANVGVGITNPNGKLVVRSGSTDPATYSNGKTLFVSGSFGSGQAYDGGVEFRHDNLSQGIGFGYNTIYQTGSNANQDLNLIAKGSSNLTLQAYGGVTGNVGIGLTGPVGKLEVSAPNTNVASGVFHLTGGQSWGNVLTVATDNTAGADNPRINFSYRNKAKQWELGGYNADTRFSLWEDGGDGTYGSGWGNERITVNAGGFTGINATNPQVRLAVNGNGTNVYNTDIWVENNIHVQGNETMAMGGGRGRLRVGTAWGYDGLYTEAASNGTANDLVLGSGSGQVRIGPDGTGQNLKVNGQLTVMNGGVFNGTAYSRDWGDASGTTIGRVYSNADNAFSGGIAISDDGGFYDRNDGWIRFDGSTGIVMDGNNGSSIEYFDMNDNSGIHDKQVVTSNGNWGLVGTSGNYWYYMYAGNYYYGSRRELKRDITPIQGGLAKTVMDDLDKMKPSFFKLKVDQDEWVEGQETKFRPNYHLGLIVDESPDYIQDQTFSGLDLASVATLGVLGAKVNREEIKAIKSAIGMDGSTVNISDFGNAVVTGNTVEVTFSADFAQKLGSALPIVTATSTNATTQISVIETTANGFKVHVEGNQSGSFNWIAMAKVNVAAPQASTNEQVSPETMKGMKVDQATKDKIHAYWAKNKQYYDDLRDHKLDNTVLPATQPGKK